MRVIDRYTGKTLSAFEILEEVNRDRSDDWQNFDVSDLVESPLDVLNWVDNQYWEIEQ